VEKSSYEQTLVLARSVFESMVRHEEREFGPEIARKLSERTGQEEKPLSTTECHVLECVWRGTKTAARIAEDLRMTRGGVSKAISKLSDKGFLETARSQESAREVVLALTPRGEALCEIHAEMHAARLERWSSYLDTFSDDELRVVHRFLEGFIREEAVH